jgi:2-methylcitrate dehydratase PrpD
MTRLGAAIGGPDQLFRGVWPSYLAAPLAAAAVAARCLQLNRTQTAQALSLACMRIAGGIGRFSGSPSGRWFVFAGAVADGVAAAEAAAQGFGGDPALLDGDFFPATHGLSVDPADLTRGLGDGSVFPQLSCKPFCSAKQALAAVEAFAELLGDDIKPELIERIRVRVPPPYARMVSQPVLPGVRSSGLVSVANQLALTAYAPERLSDVDRSQALADEQARVLAGRVEVVADPELLAFYPRHWPAEVEVEIGGDTLRRRIVEATGDPEHPLDAAALAGKAHRVLDGMIGADRVNGFLAECGAGGRRLADAYAAIFSEQGWTR